MFDELTKRFVYTQIRDPFQALPELRAGRKRGRRSGNPEAKRRSRAR